jgi:pimeloyl-ACP methyl ester carboxylesterase
MPDHTPTWFRAALEAPTEHGVLDVDGVAITYRSWGSASGSGGTGTADGVVLVHGGSAHAAWWDHVGPLLAEGRRVSALDLSGHGDSGRRADYRMDSWAEEVMAVATANGMTRPVVVGHSMGGWVTCATGAAFGEQLGGIVIVDAPLEPLPPEHRVLSRKRSESPVPVYPSQAEALARFRLIPEQPGALPYVFDHIARTSIREVDGTFTWKFDTGMFPAIADFNPGQVLVGLRCRFAAVRGELGIVPADLADQVRPILGRPAPVVTIPDAGHHLMVDHPLALVAVLRTLLQVWTAEQPSG